jgi:uncharacterized protein YjbJ (UPF0337 family)
VGINKDQAKGSIQGISGAIQGKRGGVKELLKASIKDY